MAPTIGAMLHSWFGGGDVVHSGTRALLAAALALATSGCFSAPSPPPPSSAERMIGADFSSSALGHWSCPAADILLAKRDGGLVLHELTLDAVASQAKPIAGERLQFIVGLGNSSWIYAVPRDNTQPAWVLVNMVSENRMTLVYDRPVQSTANPNEVVFSTTIENKQGNVNAVVCPPAPLPRFL